MALTLTGTVAEYIRCCTPEQIHGVCEDYRAAATLDFEMETQDFEAGNTVRCPMLVLWGVTTRRSRRRTRRTGRSPVSSRPEATQGYTEKSASAFS